MSPKFDRKKSITPLNGENHENGVQKENRPTVVSAHAEYAGPIPPAEEFAKYGQVIPDAPERILSVFEKDSEHVRHMNSESLKAEYNTNKRSQWMAFLCIMAYFQRKSNCISKKILGKIKHSTFYKIYKTLSAFLFGYRIKFLNFDSIRFGFEAFYYAAAIRRHKINAIGCARLFIDDRPLTITTFFRHKKTSWFIFGGQSVII